MADTSESLPECANAPSFRFQRITGITRLAEASLIDRALAAATALRNKSPPGSQAVRHPLHRLTNTKRLRACCMTLRHPSAQLAMNWPPGALSPGLVLRLNAAWRLACWTRLDSRPGWCDGCGAKIKAGQPARGSDHCVA